MAGRTVYIASEDSVVRDSVAKLVASAGLTGEPISSLEAWIEAAEPVSESCLVLDAGGGDLVEPARLARFTAACARIPVLVLTDRGDVSTAVKAIKQGAVDVVQKPFADRSLLDHIEQMLRSERDGVAKG